jgi:large subunit ribosomal protein L6
MSRIGKMPIPIPNGVDISIDGQRVTVKGPRGELTHVVHPRISFEVANLEIAITRSSDVPNDRALHGLTRALLSNMVNGVNEGYQKNLELVGVGYRAQQNGDDVVLQVGFSHPVDVVAPAGVALTVEGNNRIHVEGVDKQSVGEIAARIRRIRPPNKYTGKGIRYSGEQIRLRPGKAAGRRA